MKIAYGSDFHFNFYAPLEARDIINYWEFDKDTDLIIIAGDLHVGCDAVTEMLQYIRYTHNIPIIYVTGNHEYYGSSIEKENEKFRDVFDSNFDILIRDYFIKVKENVKFFGCTGHIDNSYEVITKLKHGQLNDFYYIKDFEEYHHIFGRRDRKALNEYGYQGIDVVITHTMPSPKCISYKYTGSYLNPCFANNWEHEIYTHKPKIWICGHTHDSIDMMMHETRVIANPYGYPHENHNWEWKYVTV